MEKDNDKPRETAGNDRWDISVTSSARETKESGDNYENPGRAAEAPTVPVEIKLRYPLWVMMLAIIGVWFAALIFVGLLFPGYTLEEGIAGGPETLIRQVVFFGITIGFSWWLCRRHGNLPAKPLRFSLKKTNPTLILWGLIIVIVTSMVLEPLLDVFPREYLQKINLGIGTGGWAMLTTIIAIPILEEILFRGILQQELVAGYGRVKGVLMAAAVFGIAHIYPQQAINAFFIGIILGYLFIKSQSLVPAIIIHALNNAIAYIIMHFSGGNFSLTKDLFGNETFYWIIYGVCCVIFIIAGWNFIRELNKSDKQLEKVG